MLALTAGLATPGCGFRPLYGSSPGGVGQGVTDGLASVAVIQGASRVHQVMYGDLLDRLTPYGAPAQPRYELNVRLAESREGVALERDATVTRFNLTLEAEYVLRDAQTRQALTAGNVRAIAAYNVLRSEFTNVAAARDAQERAAQVLADEIKTRLAVYFGGLAPAGP